MDVRIRTLAFVALMAVDSPAEPGPSRDVRLVFDASASELPQAEIRASVEREIGRPSLDGGAPGEPELHIGVNAEGALVLSYGVPGEEPAERVLRRPERSEDVAELVALAVGTLVRRQSAQLVPDAAPAAKQDPLPGPTGPPTEPELVPKPDVPSRSPTPRAAGDVPPRSFLGAALGADFLFVPTVSSVCSPSHLSPAHGPSFDCYGPDGKPLQSTTEGKNGAVAGGYSTGTSRVVLSFDRAFTEHFRAGLRVGMAFDPTPIAHFPLHAEAKVAHVFGLPRAGAWRLELFAGLGVARVTGHMKASVIDDKTNAAVPVDVYVSAGSLFGSGGAGLVYQPTASLEIEASLELMGLLPQAAVSLTPWIAARFGL